MEVERDAQMAQDVGSTSAEPQPSQRGQSMESHRVSSWAVGWTAFAGVMMVVSGLWWIIAGIIALVDDNFYVVTKNYVFKFDVTTWGWIHLGFGILAMIAGIFLFTGAVWARIVGVLIATLAAVVAFAWIPYYPVMAIILVAVSAAVIWALTVHGRDIAMA
jgi:hypothetical protein